MLVLFVQYFVLISPDMLEMAFSNAAQSELSSFPKAILQEWIQPFEPGEVIFVFLVKEPTSQSNHWKLLNK